MTGDGLRFAIRGAELAALEALDALERGAAGAHVRLHEQRRREFRSKWIFNRAMRRLVASPLSVTVAGLAADVLPSCIEAAVRMAGDVDLPPEAGSHGLPAQAGSHGLSGRAGSHRVRPT
jgi:flavin-dependent dehydrogenase